MRVKKATLTLPEWKVAISFRTYIIILAIVCVCVLATVLAAQKGLGKLPAETMRDASVRKSNNLKLSNRLDYKTKWMLRDNMQNIVRWIMSIIGVAGSMVLMMAGLGFRDSINYSNNYVYNKQYDYEYKVVLNSGYIPDDYNNLIGKIQGNYQSVYESNADILYTNSTDKERRIITVLDDGDYVHLETIDSKKLILKPNTVAISNKIASILGVKKGDVVKIRILGSKEWKNAKISDVVIAPSPQGIFVSRESIGRKILRNMYIPNAILLDSKERL